MQPYSHYVKMIKLGIDIKELDDDKIKKLLAHYGWLDSTPPFRASRQSALIRLICNLPPIDRVRIGNWYSNGGDVADISLPSEPLPAPEAHPLPLQLRDLRPAAATDYRLVVGCIAAHRLRQQLTGMHPGVGQISGAAQPAGATSLGLPTTVPGLPSDPLGGGDPGTADGGDETSPNEESTPGVEPSSGGGDTSNGGESSGGRDASGGGSSSGGGNSFGGGSLMVEGNPSGGGNAWGRDTLVGPRHSTSRKTNYSDCQPYSKRP